MKKLRTILNNTKNAFKSKELHRNRVLLETAKKLGFAMPNIRRALVCLNGIDVQQLADANGMSSPPIYAAIKNEKPKGKGETILAQTLGLNMDEIYPESIQQ